MKIVRLRKIALVESPWHCVTILVRVERDISDLDFSASRVLYHWTAMIIEVLEVELEI